MYPILCAPGKKSFFGPTLFAADGASMGKWVMSGGRRLTVGKNSGGGVADDRFVDAAGGRQAIARRWSASIRS
jgi:hypothetical protein